MTGTTIGPHTPSVGASTPTPLIPATTDAGHASGALRQRAGQLWGNRMRGPLILLTCFVAGVLALATCFDL